MLRRDAGEYGGAGDHAFPAGLVEISQLAAVDGRQRLVSRVAVDPQLARDGGGGRRLIPGDHDHSDAGLPAGGDGGLDLVPQRVHHADQADENQFPVVVGFPIALREFAVGQSQHA